MSNFLLFPYKFPTISPRIILKY